MPKRTPAPLTFTGRQLTPTEAADLLNVSLNTIRRMIYRGELRARRSVLPDSCGSTRPTSPPLARTLTPWLTRTSAAMPHELPEREKPPHRYTRQDGPRDSPQRTRQHRSRRTLAAPRPTREDRPHHGPSRTP